MKELSSKNFGLLIAYLLPGFVALLGVSYFSATVRGLLTITEATTAPTVGGFLYLTLASVAAGLTASTVRWAVIDTLHHRTGIRPPGWDFGRLQEHVEAYIILVENHYRFFQFYANMLMSLVFTWACRRAALSPPLGWFDLAFGLLVVILFAGSRDALAKYYTRGLCLLGNAESACAPDAVGPKPSSADE